MPAGRLPKNVEFLRTLKSFFEMNNAEFAEACGKKAGNMNNYLNNKLKPKKAVLRSCAENLFGWVITPVLEVEKLPKSPEITEKPGLYVLYDSGGNVLYIGKAKKLNQEVRQTLARKIPIPIRIGKKLGKRRPKIKELAHYISMYTIPVNRLRHNLEVLLLRVMPNQTHNTNIGKFK